MSNFLKKYQINPEKLPNLVTLYTLFRYPCVPHCPTPPISLHTDVGTYAWEDEQVSEWTQKTFVRGL